MSEVTSPEPGTAPEPSVLCGVPLSDSRGQRVLHPTRDGYIALLRTLLDETFTMCADLTAVDYLLHMGRADTAAVPAAAAAAHHLPWQVMPLPDGGSTVMGLRLGRGLLRLRLEGGGGGLI